MALPIGCTKVGALARTHACALVVEEILGATEAVWWSASGEHLVYMTFDDTNVPLMRYPYYDAQDAYTRPINISYSKVGYPLPRVTLSVWTKSTRLARLFVLPSQVANMR
jgi:hypothetical protein